VPTTIEPNMGRMLSVARRPDRLRHASFTTATTMPISTTTTIAACVQIQKGDIHHSVVRRPD